MLKTKCKVKKGGVTSHTTTIGWTLGMILAEDDDFIPSKSTLVKKGKERLKKRCKRTATSDTSNPFDGSVKRQGSSIDKEENKSDCLIEEYVPDSMDEAEKESVAPSHSLHLDVPSHDHLAESSSSVNAASHDHLAESSSSVHAASHDHLAESSSSSSSVHAHSIQCPGCSIDITHQSEADRIDHVNRCLDATTHETTHIHPHHAVSCLNELAFCPSCTLPWTEDPFEHVKKCTRLHSIDCQSLLQDVGIHLDPSLFQELDDFSIQKSKPMKIKTSAKNDKKDEQLQMALALSASLKEESPNEIQERIEKAHKIRSGPPVLFYSKILSTTKHIITLHSPKRRRNNFTRETLLLPPEESHALIYEQVCKRVNTPGSSDKSPMTLFEQSHQMDSNSSIPSTRTPETETQLDKIHKEYIREYRVSENRLYQEIQALQKKHQDYASIDEID